MKIIKHDELRLSGHDVYEFSYNRNYPRHWNEDSVYISSENIQILEKFINSVIKDFHYYGPQKIYDYQWKNLFDLSVGELPELHEFFGIMED